MFKEFLLEKSEGSPFDNLKKGALHKWCGIPEDEKITCECIKKALKAGGHPAKMAEFAKGLGKVECD